MKAIIVAAGMGRRLAPYTDDRPKCLVEVAGKTILARQLDAYRAAGVNEIHVVRGYLAERIDVPDVHYFENPDYRANNILASLFCAEAAMSGGFFFSYSDIVFRPDAVRALVASDADYSLIIDRRWADAYHGRDLHPISEAELARVDAGRVLRVGKKLVTPADAHGEFIGLARFSAAAADQMRASWHQLLRDRGPEPPFGTAPHLRTAYLTDLLNHLLDAGAAMRSIDIDGDWREIDTTQDLERAHSLVASW